MLSVETALNMDWSFFPRVPQVGVLVQKLAQLSEDSSPLLLPLLKELKDDYATHPRWSYRHL